MNEDIRQLRAVLRAIDKAIRSVEAARDQAQPGPSDPRPKREVVKRIVWDIECALDALQHAEEVGMDWGRAITGPGMAP